MASLGQVLMNPRESVYNERRHSDNEQNWLQIEKYTHSHCGNRKIEQEDTEETRGSDRGSMSGEENRGRKQVDGEEKENLAEHSDKLAAK